MGRIGVAPGLCVCVCVCVHVHARVCVCACVLVYGLGKRGKREEELVQGGLYSPPDVHAGISQL